MPTQFLTMYNKTRVGFLMNSNVLQAIFPILVLATQVNVSAFAFILVETMEYKVSIRT